jgi:hypothetical protein
LLALAVSNLEQYGTTVVAASGNEPKADEASDVIHRPSIYTAT